MVFHYNIHSLCLRFVTGDRGVGNMKCFSRGAYSVLDNIMLTVSISALMLNCGCKSKVRSLL